MIRRPPYPTIAILVLVVGSATTIALGEPSPEAGLTVAAPRTGDDGRLRVEVPLYRDGAYHAVAMDVAFTVGPTEGRTDAFGVRRWTYPLHLDALCDDAWCIDLEYWIDPGSQLAVRGQARGVGVPIASTTLPDPFHMIRDEEPFELAFLGPRFVAPHSLVGLHLRPGDLLSVEDAPYPIDAPAARFEAEVLAWTPEGTLPVRHERVLGPYAGLALTRTFHFDRVHPIPVREEWQLVGPAWLVPGGAITGESVLLSWSQGTGAPLANAPTPPFAERREGAAFRPWTDEGPTEPAANGYTLANAILALRSDARAAAFFADHPTPTLVGATAVSVTPLGADPGDSWTITLGEPGGLVRLQARVDGRQVGDLVLAEEVVSVQTATSWIPAPPAGVFEGRALACLQAAREALAESREGRALAPMPEALFQNVRPQRLAGGYDVHCDAIVAVLPPDAEARTDPSEAGLVAVYAAADVFGVRGARGGEWHARQTVVVGLPGSG